METETQTLLARLNPVCKRGLELAAQLCVSETHYSVEVEHLLTRLLELPAIDLQPVLEHFGVDHDELAHQLSQALETFDRGNRRTPSFSPEVLRLLREGWGFSSLALQSTSIRSSALLLALMHDRALRLRALGSCPVLAHIPRDMPIESLREVIRDSAEETGQPTLPLSEPLPRYDDDAASEPEGQRGLTEQRTNGAARGPAPAAPETSAGDTGLIGDSEARSPDATRQSAGPRAHDDKPDEPAEQPGNENEQTPALDRYTIDLVESARAGRIDPICERDQEIRLLIDTLCRRRQNNPILVGDAGVGKTAVVEGLALRVAAGDMPLRLADMSLRQLDLGLLQAGAGVKGEFERRLKDVISEIEAATVPVILFVDEAHTLIGAGGPAGSGDAANLLKPALAAGDLRTIAATTWSEYKQYFERDPALARRFQLITVAEATEEQAVAMLSGAAPSLEAHHGVRVLEEAVSEAVRLSMRYIPERRLPAKAISVLDTAAARVSLAQTGKPAEIEDLATRLEQVDRDRSRQLAEELLTPGGENLDSASLATGNSATIDLDAERTALQDQLEELDRRWRAEQEAVGRIREIEGRLLPRRHEPPIWPGAEEADTSISRASGPESSGLKEELHRLHTDLAEIQGDKPLVPLNVDARAVAEVISGWTGVPVGRMLRDEVESYLDLEDRLGQHIVGQEQALATISRRLRTALAGLDDPNKPKGVFLLAGPSGVGKTETGKALAVEIFGSDQRLITLNMSEYQEPHSVATLKGSPPGYVGYGEGGLLTEAVRRQPHCVLLFDEIEKAHPDVVDLLVQVFDRGVLEDGEGIAVDFNSTVILLTTGLGGTEVTEATTDKAEPESEPSLDLLARALAKRLQPGLLDRLDVIPYRPLAAEQIRQIVEQKLGAVQNRVRKNHLAELTFDPSLIDSLASRCQDKGTGAREIERTLNDSLLPELSVKILEHMASGSVFSRIRITVDENGDFL